MPERLQKIIARAGIASRRASEELITSGRVRVNGHVITELGAKADLRDDKIEVDGRRIIFAAPRYIVFHKPRNVVSTLSDPEGRPTIADYIKDAGKRLYPVGRLDFATSGVLLATNDGDFANGLLHPKGGVPKTYVVKVRGVMGEDDLDLWRKGVNLDDGRTLPADIRFLRHEDDKTWFEITLREGRNQQIRRMGEATSFPVMRLARISFAGITHEDLRPGEWRSLKLDELLELRKQYGVPKRVRSASLESPAPHPTGRAPRAKSPAPSRARPSRDERPSRATRDERPTRAPRDERPTRAPRDERPTRPTRDERPARSARSDRSGTTPRGAAKPSPRARARGDR